jgi:hypothetical protein
MQSLAGLLCSPRQVRSNFLASEVEFTESSQTVQGIWSWFHQGFCTEKLDGRFFLEALEYKK